MTSKINKKVLQSVVEGINNTSKNIILESLKLAEDGIIANIVNEITDQCDNVSDVNVASEYNKDDTYVRKLNISSFTKKEAYFFKCPYCDSIEYTFFKHGSNGKHPLICMSCYKILEVHDI